MKFGDFILYMLEDYVSNEIDYLCQELAICENNKDSVSVECYKRDLKYLESLNNEDLINIVDNIYNHTDIEGIINDVIQEYLYKYQNDKEEEK